MHLLVMNCVTRTEHQLQELHLDFQEGQYILHIPYYMYADIHTCMKLKKQSDSTRY